MWQNVQMSEQMCSLGRRTSCCNAKQSANRHKQQLTWQNVQTSVLVDVVFVFCHCAAGSVQQHLHLLQFLSNIAVTLLQLLSNITETLTNLTVTLLQLFSNITVTLTNLTVTLLQFLSNVTIKLLTDKLLAVSLLS